MTGPDPAVVLINPLPATLRHYEAAVVSVLRTAGVATASGSTTSIEMSDGGQRGRPARAAAVLLQRLRRPQHPGPRLSLWPVFGLADPATWLRSRRRTWIVVHDPRPLRRQFGMGRVAATAGGWASRHGTGVVTHSAPAAEILRSNGWRTELLPMPIEAPAPADPAATAWVTVLGQWKPARDLAPLHELARCDDLTGRRRVLGRGWPDIEGWSVADRFVSEAELTAAVSSSACVLLPYAQYFQSDIAVRCLELGVPVVGFRHPFLESLYGEDWPGVVAGDDWLGAIARVLDVDRGTVIARRDAYRAECVAAWAKFVQTLVSRSGIDRAQN